MIIIVDYGMGNLRSVSKALEHLGAKVKISSRSKEILQADKIILPGVGAFGDAMAELRKIELIDTLRDAFQNQKKILGICLGMQLLFSSSEESPEVEGLEFFKGKAQTFRSQDVKVPHMGWNSVKVSQNHPLLQGVPSGSYFYFVHSYYVVPKDHGLTAAECTYGSETFPAMIGTGHVFATQFHPEKSQEAGLKILKNFINW